MIAAKKSEKVMRFGQSKVVVKDFGVGKNGKSDTIYTLSIQQSDGNEWRLRLTWRDVKHMFKLARLNYAQVKATANPDERVRKGVDLLIESLHAEDRDKFLADFSM